MFVHNHMIPARSVITLSQGLSLKEALDTMYLHGHDALPVVQGGQVVGLLSKQHIYKSFFLGDFPDKDEFLQERKVHVEMKTDFRTIRADDLLEKALQSMAIMRMQFLTVLDKEGNLAGLLTKRSLLETLGNSLGLGKRGTRIEIVISDVEGRLAALTKAFYRAKLNIISVVLLDPEIMDFRKIVMRLNTNDKDAVVSLVEKEGFRVLNAFVEE